MKLWTKKREAAFGDLVELYALRTINPQQRKELKRLQFWRQRLLAPKYTEEEKRNIRNQRRKTQRLMKKLKEILKHEH